MFTASWLHGSIDHLIGNLLALAVAGTILERHIGTTWLAAIYLAGGIAGSIGSMVLGDPHMVGVGASGAIMALVALVFALSFHASLANHAKRLRRLSLFTLVPALAPSAAHGAQIIDVGAHFGGLLAGMGAAYVLFFLWNEEKPIPEGREFAATLAVVFAALATVSATQIAIHAPEYQARMAALAPLSALDEKVLPGQGPALLARYPHDPGLRLALSLAALKSERYGSAETDARAGLQEKAALLEFFPPQTEQQLQIMLALALLGQGRKAAAMEAAEPVCNSTLSAILTEARLCAGSSSPEHRTSRQK